MPDPWSVDETTRPPGTQRIAESALARAQLFQRSAPPTPQGAPSALSMAIGPLCPIARECHECERDGDGHRDRRNDPRENSVCIHDVPHLPNNFVGMSMTLMWELYAGRPSSSVNPFTQRQKKTGCGGRNGVSIRAGVDRQAERVDLAVIGFPIQTVAGG